MANEDTAQVQTSDGKVWNVPRANLTQALKRPGVKLYAGQTAAPKVAATTPAFSSTGGPGPVKRLVTQAVGLPENVDTSLEGNLKGLNELGTTKAWVDALKQAFESLNPVGGMSEARTAALARLRQPGQRLKGGAEYLMSGFPYAGPAAVRSVEQATEGDWAGSIGSAIQAALLHRGAPELAKRVATGPARTLAQFVAGVGEENVKKAAAEEGKSNLAKAGKRDEELQKVSGEIGESGQKAVERSKAESGTSAKKALDTGALRGPVYQRVEGMVNEVGDDVQNLDQKTREKQNVEWNKLREAAKDVEVPDPEDAVTKARASLQTPEARAQFDRVMDQTRAESVEENKGVRALSTTEQNLALLARQLLKQGRSGPEVVSVLQNQGLAPRQVGAVISSLPELAKALPEGGPLSFGEARARFTKLGEKLYAGRDLPGDVHRALKQVQGAYDKNIGNSLSSLTLRKFYTDLKSDWAQYMSDFYDPNGPFTKLKGAATPTDRIGVLTGKWGKEIMDAASRYGYSPEKVRSVRTLLRQIESLPGTVPKPGEAVTKSRIPPEPEITPFDPIATRRRILQGQPVTGITPSIWMKYQILRALTQKIKNLPKVQDYLSQNPQ